MRREGTPLPIVIEARYAPPFVLAGNDAAMSVERVTVMIAARRCKDAHRTVVLDIAQDPIVRNVRPQDVSGGRDVDRPFGPAAAGPEPLEFRMRDDEFCEALVMNLVVTHRK